MFNLWIRAIRDMQHEALVAMWMPHVDSSSFMTWREGAGTMVGVPQICGC